MTLSIFNFRSALLQLIVVAALLIMSLTFSLNSYAGYAFTPSVSYSPNQNSQQGSDIQSSASSFDFRLGYAFDFGLYLGGFYSLSDDRPGAPSAVGSSSYVVGPSVGYTRWNAFAILTYIIHGERDLDSGGVKYGAAEGVNFDLGYVFNITKTFALGPQLTYKKVTYSSYQYNEIDQDQPNSKWEIYTPAIVAWFQF